MFRLTQNSTSGSCVVLCVCACLWFMESNLALILSCCLCIFSIFSVFSITWSGRKEQMRSCVYHFLKLSVKAVNAGGMDVYTSWHTGPLWSCFLRCCYCSSVSKRLALPLRHWEYGQDCRGSHSVHPEYTHSGCTWCRHKTKAARQHSD